MTKKRFKQFQRSLKKQFSEKNLTKLIANSKIAKLMHQKQIKYGLIPLLLIVFALSFTVWSAINSDDAITLLTKPGNKSYFHNYHQDPLTAGEIISGEFVATDNNLGMVSVLFENHEYAGDQTITFRIKEQGTDSWLTENDYLTSQFHHLGYMYFGLPVQTNSKEKTYLFEIEIKEEPAVVIYEDPTSEASVETVMNLEEDLVLDEELFDNPLTMGVAEPVVRTHYKYSKDELLANRQLAIYFVTVKLLELMKSVEIIFINILGLIPLIIYLLYLVKERWFQHEFSTLKDMLSLFLIIYLSLEIIKQLGMIFELNVIGPSLSSLLITLVIMTPLLFLLIGQKHHEAK